MGIICAVSLLAFNNKRVFQSLILHPVSVIHKKEYYRILSSALVHNNMLHLGLNLLMLYVFCSGLEESASGPGRLGLLIIMGASLLAGHLLSVIAHRRDIAYSGAGASGIAIGCMCSYFIFHPLKSHVSIPLIDSIPNVYAAAGYLALMLLYSRKNNGGKIDYSVHVGGGIGGAAVSLLLQPFLLTNVF